MLATRFSLIVKRCRSEVVSPQMAQMIADGFVHGLQLNGDALASTVLGTFLSALICAICGRKSVFYN